MIFVTIGTQLPFDRLIKLADAAAAQLDIEFVAQIGSGNHIPKHMKYERYFTADETDSYIAQSTLVISHAGMGTILTSLVNAKALLIVPRYAKYGEHRNDHQLATSVRFEKLRGVHVAYDVDSLIPYLDGQQQSATTKPIPLFAPDAMILELRKRINE